MTNLTADDIIADLRPFADPFSDIDVTPSDHGYRISWTSRRTRLSAVIHNTAEPRVFFNETELSYAQFLAHERLGNLIALADTTILWLDGKPKDQPPPIDAPACLTTTSTTRQGPAHEIIDHAVQNHAPQGTTYVLFLAARAGSGKTRALQRLVLEGAKRFVSGKSRFLYFYVNAQGRSLARVDEAFAVELDDLGASFGFSGIAPLTRAGILVPVIDGFDELIGPVGYDDAFQSLGRFLDSLNGKGQLVTAARSTYYEREFQARVRQHAQHDRSWSLDTVTLLPWREDERRQALDLLVKAQTVEPTPEAIEEARRVLCTRDDQLDRFFELPFFAIHAANAILAGEKLGGSDALLRRLTDALLSRELKDKFLDERGIPLATKDQLWSFFREVAGEMWYQQTRALDETSLKDVIAIATDGWSEKAINLLRNRVRDLPIFVTTDGRRTEFAHEYFFALFLADVVAAAIDHGGYELENVLSRGLLPEGVGDQIAYMNLSFQTCVDRFNTVCTANALYKPRICENAGNVFASIFNHQCERPDSLRLRGMFFGNVELRGRVNRLDCEKCTFHRTDLSLLEVLDGDWSSSELDLVIVKPGSTRLKATGLTVGTNVRGLTVRGDRDDEEIWEPRRVTDILRSLEAVIPKEVDARSIPDPVLDVVKGVVRAYLKSVHFASDGDVNAPFTRDQEWPDVRHALLESELVKVETRETRGQRKTFFRCQFNPEELLAGLSRNANVDHRVHAFWDILERLAANP